MSEDTDKLALARRLIAPLMPKWGPAPAGSVCTACKAETLERSTITVARWGGSVRCASCGHTETVMSYLGKTCFHVEPL